MHRNVGRSLAWAADSTRGRLRAVVAAGLGLAVLTGAAQARAQEPAPTPTPTPAPAEEERSTGLPKAGHWTFNLDAGLGGFGFANSLYTNAHPDPSGNLGDNWAESFIKPAISANFDVGEERALRQAERRRRAHLRRPAVARRRGRLLVQDRGRVPRLALGEVDGTPRTSSTSPWAGRSTRSATASCSGTGAAKAAAAAATGATPARPGSSPRSAASSRSTTPSRPSTWTATRSRRARRERASGVANYEFALSETTTLGATYLKFYADKDEKPDRDGLNVYNARAFTAPFKSLPGLAFELEYAHEQNGDLLKSDAWTAQAGYEMGKVAWKPRLSYRYAFFEGDDPATPTNEAFDSLLPGFYDWGTWWQGEIAGEYFVSNSNLISHQVRLHLTPSESVSGGLMAFLFKLDKLPVTEPPAHLEGHRVRARRLLRLEAQQGLHRELPRGLREPAEVRGAGLRPDQELRVRNDLPRLLLLSLSPHVSRRRRVMIETSKRALVRRVLIVDDALADATTAGGRSVRALAEELRRPRDRGRRGAVLRGRPRDRRLRLRDPLRLRQLDAGQQRPQPHAAGDASCCARCARGTPRCRSS